MSMENAKKLLKELKENKDMQAKIAGIKAPEELVKIASEAGYNVTVEDLEQADKQLRAEQAEKNELGAEELEKAAGGAIWINDMLPKGMNSIALRAITTTIMSLTMSTGGRITSYVITAMSALRA